MVPKAFSIVSIFSFSLLSDPEFKSPPTVRVPVEGLKLNAVAVSLMLGARTPVPSTNTG
jgi:hypothetical protein